ncbi:hypothetical protein PMAYCL1PPCAC_04201, partial [Pristionchus mayeri]
GRRRKEKERGEVVHLINYFQTFPPVHSARQDLNFDYQANPPSVANPRALANRRLLLSSPAQGEHPVQMEAELVEMGHPQQPHHSFSFTIA